MELSKYFYLLAAFLFLLLANCEKDDPAPRPDPVEEEPVDTLYFAIEGVRVSNGMPEEISFTSVEIKADFSAFNAETFEVTDYGHVVSKTSPSPTVTNNDGRSSLGMRNGTIGPFTSVVDSLEPGTAYFARVYIEKTNKSDGAVSYAYHPNHISFRTLEGETPTVGEAGSANVAHNSASVNALILDFKGLDVTDHGFVWSSENNTPSTEDNEGMIRLGAVSQTDNHAFSNTLTGLTPSTSYFIRPFAENQTGTGYGSAIEVTTTAAPMAELVIEEVFLVSDENNTGNANPGETVTFGIRLKNTGSEEAQDVKVNLSGSVGFPSSQPIDFGSVLVNSTKTRQFDIRIPDTAVEGQLFGILVEISSGEFQWAYPNAFYVEVFASPVPEITIENILLVSDENNTGQANPGETVTYSVTARNVGEVTAEEVGIMFSGPVNFLSAQPIDFGTILAGGSKAKQVELQIPVAAVEGQLFGLSAEINSGELQWIYTNFFYIEAVAPPAPEIIVEEVFILSDENNTGEANPGEQVTYGVTLRNIGDQTADNVDATFSGDVGFLSSQPVAFGTILPNDTKTRQLEVQVPENALWGQFFNITVDIADNASQWFYPNAFAIEVLSPYVVSDGLIFYLPFDECASGTAGDVIAGNDGELFGPEFSADILPGATGCSMDFNSQEQDYILFPNNPINSTSKLSFSFWLRTTSSNFCIFMGTSQIQVANKLTLRVLDAEWYCYPFFISDYDLTNYLDGQWHHFVLISKDPNTGSDPKLYIDGSLKEIPTGNTISSSSNGSGAFIGKNNFYPSNAVYYDGKLDNFRIYNRTLSEEEVEQIYTARQ